MKHLLPIALAFLLTGCVTEGTRTVDGRNLGEPKVKALVLKDSKIKVPQEIAKEVTKTYRKDFPSGRNVEFVDFSYGQISAEFIFGGHYFPFPDARNVKRIFEDATLRDKKVDLESATVKNEQKMVYLEFMHEDLVCVAFMRPVGDLGEGNRGTNGSLRGLGCRDAASSSAAEIAEAFKKIRVR